MKKKETHIHIIILFFLNCSPKVILKKKLCAMKIFERMHYYLLLFIIFIILFIIIIIILICNRFVFKNNI